MWTPESIVKFIDDTDRARSMEREGEEMQHRDSEADRLDGISEIPIQTVSDSRAPVYVLGLECLIGCEV